MLIMLRSKDHCQPDLIQYDFIIKMETLESDMMQVFNFTELFPLKNIVCVQIDTLSPDFIIIKMESLALC